MEERVEGLTEKDEEGEWSGEVRVGGDWGVLVRIWGSLGGKVGILEPEDCRDEEGKLDEKLRGLKS
jgi:hypothetical protein